MNENKVPENRAYKVTLILLVGLAAFSTAMKDLNRLQGMVSSLQEFTTQWRGSDLASRNEGLTSSQEIIASSESCPEGSSSARIAYVRDLGIETNNYEMVSEPEVGGKVELVGSKKLNSNVPSLVRTRFAPARPLKQAFSFKRRDGKWPAHFEFKTPDRTVILNLPMTMLTNIKADEVDTEVSPDFPRSLLGRINRKQSYGKTDNGRRELMIKRLERSFSSRRAG